MLLLPWSHDLTHCHSKTQQPDLHWCLLEWWGHLLLLYQAGRSPQAYLAQNQSEVPYR